MEETNSHELVQHNILSYLRCVQPEKICCYQNMLKGT